MLSFNMNSVRTHSTEKLYASHTGLADFARFWSILAPTVKKRDYDTAELFAAAQEAAMERKRRAEERLMTGTYSLTLKRAEAIAFASLANVHGLLYNFSAPNLTKGTILITLAYSEAEKSKRIAKAYAEQGAALNALQACEAGAPVETVETIVEDETGSDIKTA